MNAIVQIPSTADAGRRAAGLQPAISVNRLNKFYGSFHALRDIDFQVAQGEIVVLCGPSGSGKSSLIRCINHLERHDSGSIHVNGMELTRKASDVARVRRQLGMVFQSFNLFPHMTVLDNCTFALRRALRMPAAQAEALAREYLAKVNVANQADKYPAGLSGGQQQRVAIARALCLKPSIMLFDEPTSALDPESVGSVLRIMEELAATGITMVCVTHEMGFARRVAHRCVFMENGAIVEDAHSAEFFRNPRSDRLKGFLAQVL
ncbi:general L-amino acid transport system ATP-binding protein [Pseudaminobacter salicylatoxidans]|uniref:General L-amino acid transport system ATP-binding protein n=1 Tax=Pseudaminobacter salicylatoxidans TaxID=93369 RepID=A0A316C4B2_PSESE|nr:amino acid ABC transporter ATP-binding protein [Pseudaminobacter salicylatoxidans]PWJ84521.1 general L-amino acid transport system ATP-binding protein [Pseudaminobacter salicylatoxidans]